MVQNETHVLFSKRPFAITACDADLDCNWSYLDEEMALKLAFPFKQLQYTKLSVPSMDHNNTKSRCVAITKCTIQLIEGGRSGHSFSFHAKIIRDFVKISGLECIGNTKLMENIAKVKKDATLKKQQLSKSENKNTDSESDDSDSSEISNLSSLDTPIFASMDQVFSIMDENASRRAKRRKRRNFNSCNTDEEESLLEGEDPSRLEEEPTEPDSMTPFLLRQLQVQEESWEPPAPLRPFYPEPDPEVLELFSHPERFEWNKPADPSQGWLQARRRPPLNFTNPRTASWIQTDEPSPSPERSPFGRSPPF